MKVKRIKVVNNGVTIRETQSAFIYTSNKELKYCGGDILTIEDPHMGSKFIYTDIKLSEISGDLMVLIGYTSGKKCEIYVWF